MTNNEPLRAMARRCASARKRERMWRQRAQETTMPPAAHLLRTAAASRRDDAAQVQGAPHEALTLQASTLEQAAAVAGGDLTPLFAWLPQQRWTEQMGAMVNARRHQ